MIENFCRRLRYDGSGKASRADIDDAIIPKDDISVDIRTEDDTFSLLLPRMCVAPLHQTQDAACVESASR